VIAFDTDVDIKTVIEKAGDNSSNFGVFVKEGYPVGIISERDIIKNLINGYDPTMKAFDIAVKSVISVKKNRSIEYAIFLMSENNIKRLVVCDEEGKYIGVLTQDTITKHLNNNLHKNKLRAINLVKGKDIITMDESASLLDIANCFYQNKIGIMPLVKDGCMSGVVTDTDILKLARSGVDLHQKATGFMSYPPISVNEYSTVEDVLTIFEHYTIKHVVVASNNCKPLGIISKRDIIRNMNESYYSMLEKKAKNFKVAINTLASPAMELFYDGDELIVEWFNKACLDVFGEDLFDKSLSDVIDESVVRTIKVEIKSGEQKNEIIYMKDKTVFDIKLAILNENTVSIVFNNITKYHNSREFVQSLFNLLPQMVVVTDGKKLIYANESMLSFFNYKNIEAFLETHSCICDFFIEEEGYLQKGEQGSWVVESLEATKKGFGQKVKMKDKDGNERIFSVDTKLFTDNESVFVSSFFDITDAELYRSLLSAQNESLEFMVEKKTSELKQSQKLLERAQGVAKLGNCIYDLKSKNIECFGELKRILGVDSVPKTMDEFLDIFDADSAKKFRESIKELIVRKKEFATRMTLFSGGTSKTLFIKAEPYVINSEGVIEKIFGTIQDISEQVELIRKANYDSLTGIYNRHKLEEVKESIFDSLELKGASASLVIFDIDRFKLINDKYGHQKGDCILKSISESVGKSIRESDLFVRWGGEEFVILFINCKLDRALELAENLRVMIEGTTYCDIEGITCSFGVSDYRLGDDFESILARADEALYMAKNSGRNKVLSN